VPQRPLGRTGVQVSIASPLVIALLGPGPQALRRAGFSLE
jgi:hypothetical protein